MSRQARLVEVGSEGQARLASATAKVREGGLAGFVEERYLAGAGVKIEKNGAPIALPFETMHPAAEAVARGSYAALVSIKEILARR